MDETKTKKADAVLHRLSLFVAAGREPSGVAALLVTHRTACAVPLSK
jgi:hypothetical protein